MPGKDVEQAKKIDQHQVQGLDSSNECFSHQLSDKEKILVGSYKSDKVVVHLRKVTGGSESMESVRP